VSLFLYIIFSSHNFALIFSLCSKQKSEYYATEATPSYPYFLNTSINTTNVLSELVGVVDEEVVQRGKKEATQAAQEHGDLKP
jgi:hypothetical protein